MKFSFAILLMCANISVAQNLNFKGNVNYLQQKENNFASSNTIEHLLKIYEDKNYIVSISNALSVDLDCFENEIKEASVFTTLKIEF